MFILLQPRAMAALRGVARVGRAAQGSARQGNLFGAKGAAFRLDAHQLHLQCAVFLRLGGGIRAL